MTKTGPKMSPKTKKKHKKIQKKNIQEIGTKIMGKKDPAFRKPLPQPPLTSPPFPRFARANAPTEAPGLKSGFRDKKFGKMTATLTKGAAAKATAHLCRSSLSHK